MIQNYINIFIMNQKLWHPIPNDLKWRNDKLIIKGEFHKHNNKSRTLLGYDTYLLV